jgi:hypothetical protein
MSRERRSKPPRTEVDLELRVDSLAEFVEAVRKRSPPAWIFRGQSRVGDPLIPLLLRPEICPRDVEVEEFERQLLMEFQREAWPYVEQIATQLTTWEWLAIAQHHGLPTRLLDWSLNAGAALFFSVEQPVAQDSVVYAYRHAVERNRAPREPFEIRDLCVYDPPHVAGRFISQRGCFTVHPIDFPTKPRWQGELVRMIVPRECRDDIRAELRTLGIDRASLFPGLEGIAHSIRARLSNR